MIIFHSLIFSELVSVSVLKSLNWLIIISTLSLTWYSFNENEREYTFKWIIKFLELIFIISLPFLFFDIGYLKTGDKYKLVDGYHRFVDLTKDRESVIIIAAV